MTNQPRTKAGQALLAESEGNTYALEDRELFLDDILAIEAEARDTAVSETAMEAVRQHRAEAAPLDRDKIEHMARYLRRRYNLRQSIPELVMGLDNALASADKKGD